MGSLRNQKILITGATGKLARPLAGELAGENEVWGIARFRDAGARALLEASGVTTRAVDLGDGRLDDVPRDFDYVLHFAAYMGPGLDYDLALRVNAEGTGALMSHCRRAKACLVVSTGAVYGRHPDPHHLFAETDPLGDGAHPYSPTYAISKIAQEAVTRWAAREYELPTTIARMNAAYGPTGGLPARHLEAMLAGKPVAIGGDGHAAYNPIHEQDINAQIPRLLGVARTPATILNWAGDETVEAAEWCRYMADLAGVEARILPRPEAHGSVAIDNTLRRQLIGDCKVHWREGMKQMMAMRHPELASAGSP